MRVLCCEYATGGGGFEDPSLLLPDNTFLREGAAMLRSVVADLGRVPNVSVTVLRDRRLVDVTLPFGNVVPVGSAVEFHQRLAAESRRVDRVFLIAPECDGVLERCLREVEEAGGVPLTPTGELVRVASDKNETARCLAAAGVPIPLGMELLGGDALPADFAYPAVLKPADGAGSADVRLIAAWQSGRIAPRHCKRWRLERFIPGLAASILVLAMHGRSVCFPPCWQHLSNDGCFTYRGGATPIPAGLAARAEALAHAAVAALPPASGLFGLDLVLADAANRGPVAALWKASVAEVEVDGLRRASGAAEVRYAPGDVVVEVNPRLTTSYLGVRRLLVDNPLEALVTGQLPASWRLSAEATVDAPIVFTAGELGHDSQEG